MFFLFSFNTHISIKLMTSFSLLCSFMRQLTLFSNEKKTHLVCLVIFQTSAISLSYTLGPVMYFRQRHTTRKFWHLENLNHHQEIQLTFIFTERKIEIKDFFQTPKLFMKYQWWTPHEELAVLSVLIVQLRQGNVSLYFVRVWQKM